MTQSQIRQLGANTLKALMNHVPGYQSYRSDHTNTTFSSRSRHLANATHEVLLLLDGQRLNHDFAGGRFNSGLPLEGGYTLFDAHVHYQVTRQWQVYGKLRNLTDKSYDQPALINANNIQGVLGLEREIEVGIRWNFDQ